jgi:hypothetical protein
MRRAVPRAVPLLDLWKYRTAPTGDEESFRDHCSAQKIEGHGKKPVPKQRLDHPTLTCRIALYYQRWTFFC